MSDRGADGRVALLGRRGPLWLAAVLAIGFASNGPAAAVELPKRKAGLWEVKTTGGPIGAQTIQQCVDAKTDDLMGQKANADQECTEPVVSRKGNRYSVQVTCKSEGVTSRVDGSFVMTQDTAYTGDMKMTFTPPQAGMSNMDMKMDGKWLGACKAGMKPGDVVMQGMPNFNILQPGAGSGEGAGGLDPEKMRQMIEEMRKNLPKQR